MARNGSGTYSLPAGNPVVAGSTIEDTWANNTLSDIATALTNSLAKNGETTPAANLPMGGYKLTGLAAGTTNGDSVRYEQLVAKADAGAVTSSGLTQSTAKLLGRTTAGTGAVEEISVGTGLSLSAGSLTCTATAPVTSVVGQTGAVSTAQIMTALQTVDGAASGLDADLLDGQHGSYYAPASGSPNYAPMTSVTGCSYLDGGSGSGTLTFTRASGATFGVTVGTWALPGGGGACIHPHSRILMEDGSLKFACDVRPGDSVLTEIGADTVIGIWESTLGNRPLIEINKSVVVTPDHLLKTSTGWVAHDPDMYAELDAGKVRAVKTSAAGMQDINAGTIDPASVGVLSIGDVLVTPLSSEVVTSIEEFTSNQPAQPVLSFATHASETFFADGFAVAAL